MTAKQITFSTLVVSALLLVGCQPAPSHKNVKIGRNARGTSVGTRGGSPGSGSMTTQWGTITSSAGDQSFDQSLSALVQPTLEGSNDPALGFVSSTANQPTSVVFWGQASMYADSGAATSASLQGATARLHIEIWDSNAVQSGGSISPFVIHIGYDNTGFVSATGTTNGTTANLTFTDGYGSVYLQGNIQGSSFTGTIYYSNSLSGNQMVPLGQFNVPTCGFFVCQ